MIPGRRLEDDVADYGQDVSAGLSRRTCKALLFAESMLSISARGWRLRRGYLREVSKTPPGMGGKAVLRHQPADPRRDTHHTASVWELDLMHFRGSTASRSSLVLQPVRAYDERLLTHIYAGYCTWVCCGGCDGSFNFNLTRTLSAGWYKQPYLVLLLFIDRYHSIRGPTITAGPRHPISTIRCCIE